MNPNLVYVETDSGEYELVDWPNCSVPDCEYKANISGGFIFPPSDMCCIHQQLFGRSESFFPASG